MVRIPEGDFTFRVNGIEIEGDDDEGVDVQYPGEVSARDHSIPMTSENLWMDKSEVTKADFKKFMDRLTSPRQTRTISCATGRTETIPWVGATSLSRGFHAKMLGPAEVGRQAASS